MAENKEQAVVVSPGFFKLNWRDLIQGAIMAGLGAVASLIVPILESGQLEFDFDRMWKLAALAAILHIIRKLFSPPAVVVTHPTEQQMEAAKTGEAKVKVIP